MVSGASYNATVQPETLGFDRARLDRIGDWMARYVAQGKYAGSSVLIKRGEQEVFHHAAGLRDIEAGLPLQRDTVVRIYVDDKAGDCSCGDDALGTRLFLS